MFKWPEYSHLSAVLQYNCQLSKSVFPEIYEMKIITCFVLFNACYCWSKEMSAISNSAYISDRSKLTSDSEECSFAGYACSTDCTQVLFCANFKVYVIEDCEAGMWCDSERHSCSDVSPCSIVMNFTCQTTGIFPDPYDCTKYYICPDELDVEVERCDNGYAFDPGTTSCNFKTSDEVCLNGPVPRCKTAGQTGALHLNPSIYYLCVKQNNILHPLLFRCEHGYFDDELLTCADGLGSTTPSPTTSVITVTTTTTPFTCPSQGIFPNPHCCNSYYLCPISLIPYYTRCQSGTYFNNDKHTCVSGSCNSTEDCI